MANIYIFLLIQVQTVRYEFLKAPLIVLAMFINPSITVKNTWLLALNQGPCVVFRWARSRRSGMLDFRFCAVVVHWQPYEDQAKEVKSYFSNIYVSQEEFWTFAHNHERLFVDVYPMDNYGRVSSEWRNW